MDHVEQTESVAERIIIAWPNVIAMLRARDMDVSALPVTIDRQYLLGPLCEARFRISVAPISACQAIRRKTRVVFTHFRKIGTKTLRNEVNDMGEDIHDLVILSTEEETPYVKPEIQRCAGRCTVHIFPYARFQWCFIDHHLVRGVTMVYDEPTKKALLRKYSLVEVSQLPPLRKADPVHAYLNPPRGTIIMPRRVVGYESQTEFLRAAQ